LHKQPQACHTRTTPVAVAVAWGLPWNHRL
jgi:hypothetical protein